jgi:hypothetical protein
MRVVVMLLLHFASNNGLDDAIELMTFLKRSKTQDRRKFINILLASMYLIGAVITQFAVQLTITQTSSISMIIKEYVTIQWIDRVASMFVD